MTQETDSPTVGKPYGGTISGTVARHLLRSPRSTQRARSLPAQKIDRIRCDGRTGQGRLTDTGQPCGSPSRGSEVMIGMAPLGRGQRGQAIAELALIAPV